jgi:hypothetical protein
MGRTTRNLLIALTVLLTLRADGRGCSVPVFRYALERWKPSAYHVRVTSGAALTAAERELIDRLQKASATANFKLTTLDGEGEPKVTVHFPDDDPEAAPACSGPLTEAFVASLLDSPARGRLVELLAGGESAVWLLLDSGDRAADDAAARLLDAELARLSADLKLPEQDPRDLLSSKAPLKVSFVTLRVARSDPTEARLVEMLLGGEGGLDKVKGPIAFPVFGRGRVRLALHGERLRPAEIERWASSLCGPCSCVVKELNPGYDLLLAADWDGLLDLDPAAEAKSTLTAPGIPPGVSSPSAAPAEESGFPWLLAGGAALLVALTAAMALRDRRSGVA